MSEKEFRRQCKLTSLVKKKVANIFNGTLLREEYVIYFQNTRAIINGKPKVEKKKLIKKELALFYTNRSQAIEICYESHEQLLQPVLSNNIIKHGVLVKKSYYFDQNKCVLYTFEVLETSLVGLSMPNKLVLELEEPLTASDDIKETYIQYAIIFELLVDFGGNIIFSIENVRHDSNIKLDCTESYPKVDGIRGTLFFYRGYEIYTSNNKCFILQPSLCSVWGNEVCFLMMNIPFICELDNSSASKTIVFIDLAFANYFSAQQRLDFIVKLGAKVRGKSPSNASTLMLNVFFQGHDVELIRQNCKLDGEIVIHCNKLFKQKNLLTVDLQYLSAIRAMVDRDGIVYNYCKKKFKDLKNNKIYECVLDEAFNNCRRIKTVLKVRRDKFYPNSRDTVLKITRH